MFIGNLIPTEGEEQLASKYHVCWKEHFFCNCWRGRQLMGTGTILFDHWLILLMKNKSQIVLTSLQTEWQHGLLNEETESISACGYLQ